MNINKRVNRVRLTIMMTIMMAALILTNFACPQKSRAYSGISDEQSKFVKYYHKIASDLGEEYGIPWETVMAQGLQESGGGKSKLAKTKNNFFGIGAWEGHEATSYNTPEEGWRGYYKNIHNTSVYKDHGALDCPGSPYGYLECIIAAGYCSDPNYKDSITYFISEIESLSKKEGWESSRQIVQRKERQRKERQRKEKAERKAKEKILKEQQESRNNTEKIDESTNSSTNIIPYYDLWKEPQISAPYADNDIFAILLAPSDTRTMFFMRKQNSTPVNQPSKLVPAELS